MPIIGHGAVLQYSTDGTAYTTLAKLTSIGEVTLGEADEVDITTYQSADAYREFMRGLVDPASVDFTGIWEGQAVYTTLLQRMQANPPVLDYIRIVLPGDMGTFTARGFVKSLKLNPQLDGVVEVTGTLRLSGKPTFTVP